MKKVNSVEDYLNSNPGWENELIILRDTVSSKSLEETIKWGIPVYTLDGKNILGIAAFKSYVGIWFFQGAFLKDKNQKLINAQEGKTIGQRQWRFNSATEIKKDSKLITSYVKEAVKNQLDGKEIKIERKSKVIIPKELADSFKNNSKLKNSFSEFTIGKQREFAEYISEAKRDDTKLKRIEKITPLIFEGIGLNDKYKNK